MFYIYGNLNFVPGGYDKWYEAYKDLEKHVWANEPESCLTYYFGTPVEFGSKNPSASTFLLAFEQYRTRSDLYEIHFHSSAMGPFLEKIPPTMTTGLDLSHYEDVAGFLHRDDDDKKVEEKKGDLLWYDTRIWCREGKRDEVLNRLTTVVEEVPKKESGTWSYLVLRCLDDDEGIRIFERYQDHDAWEAHWKGKTLLEFWHGSKDLVRSSEARGYIPNGWGWLHR